LPRPQHLLHELPLGLQVCETSKRAHIPCDWLSPNTNHCPRICGYRIAMTELNYCVVTEVDSENPRDKVGSFSRQKLGSVIVWVRRVRRMLKRYSKQQGTGSMHLSTVAEPLD
jgi:hypothetical protein